MSSISDLGAEPWGLSAFGQSTYSAELSVYRSEILAIMGVNHAPTGANGTISMLEGASYGFATTDFGFSDPNDNPANTLLAVKITTLPTAGTLTDNGVAVTAGQLVSVTDIAAGLLTFSPAAGAYGSPYASFTFQVEDNGGTANGGVNLDPSPKTITFNVTTNNTTVTPTIAGFNPGTNSSGVAIGPASRSRSARCRSDHDQREHRLSDQRRHDGADHGFVRRGQQ